VTDIQQARDVLAKWREHATPGPWSREEMPETGENRVVREFEFFGSQIEPVAPGGMDSEDARLIVGTAGNPDLLDALDNFLWKAYRDFAYTGKLTECDEPGAVQDAERIAAAIIAADERRTS
jgi:hypothetical protein